MRKLHSLLGLWVAVLAVVLALSGAILSLDPALERQSNTLAANGLIRKLETSGRQKRFDGELHEHHHILCIRCHRVENMPTLDFALPNAEPEASRGYQITGCRIEFFGLCPEISRLRGTS